MTLNAYFVAKSLGTVVCDQKTLVTNIRMAGETSRDSSSASDGFREESVSGDETGGRLNGRLKLGSKYTSFAQLQKAVHLYCQEKKIRLFRSDSRKLKSAHIRVNPVVIEKAPECLIYYSLTYSCVFGSKSKNRCRDITSHTDPRGRGCKFSVRIGLTKDYQFLEVIKMSDPSTHSHLASDFSSKGSSPVIAQQSKITPKPKTFSSPVTETRDLPPKSTHSGIISSKLSEYRSSGLFCDTVVLASDGTVFAHSAILGMFCPKLFSSLNQRPFRSQQSNMIDLSRYPSILIDKLLDFFYLGKLCMESFDELQDLAGHLGVAFNVDKETTLDRNEDPNSTRTSSDFEDRAGSDREDSARKDAMLTLDQPRACHRTSLLPFLSVRKPICQS